MDQFFLGKLVNGQFKLFFPPFDLLLGTTGLRVAVPTQKQEESRSSNQTSSDQGIGSSEI